MTDEQKRRIGQMLMVGIPGKMSGNKFLAFAEKYYIGNYCISSDNAESVESLCNINSDIRAATHANTGAYPFISIDQEGGWVTRFYEGAALIPGEMSYSAAGADGEKMRCVGKQLGKILRAVGCNMVNSPVLDVNVDSDNPIIGTRSYGDDPERVSELGSGFVCGLTEAKVLGVVKHFPGHGNVKGDTHLGATVNGVDADTFKNTELIPFKRAFESGGAGGLMTAHVTYKGFSNEPATVSKEIMTELLRKELGFDGVAMTDSMNMNAMSKIYPNGEGAVRAIEAGCDILLFYPLSEEIFEEAIKAIYSAVESGRISEERITESYERIIRQKARFKIEYASPDLALANKLVYDSNAIESVFCDKLDSITCLKDNGVLSHLGDEKILCISPVCDALRGVEESRRKILSFADEFSKEFKNAIPCISSLGGMTDSVKNALDGEYGIAIIGVFDASCTDGQNEIIDELKKRGKKTVAVLLRSPYDYKLVSDCDAVICCYEYTTLAVNATVSAMKNNDYKGTLPINIEF